MMANREKRGSVLTCSQANSDLGKPPRSVMLRLRREDTNPRPDDIGLPVAQPYTAIATLASPHVCSGVERFTVPYWGSRVGRALDHAI